MESQLFGVYYNGLLITTGSNIRLLSEKSSGLRSLLFSITKTVSDFTMFERLHRFEIKPCDHTSIHRNKNITELLSVIVRFM